MTARAKSTAKPAQELVAITGMGCRFPGARNVREMWRLLVDGRNAVDRYPGNRFPEVDAFMESAADDPETAAMPLGGFLEAIDEFDAAAFELSPREAMYLDPQHRLLLEVAWAALEDAGQVRQDTRTRRTGVFTGLWASDFENTLYKTGADLDFYAMTGSGRAGASGRLSFAFGFEGPSLTVDAACSSSLVAVHLACRSLLAGECDMALAGGANAILATEATEMFTQAGMLARDGRCKFGSANADGFVRSEGAGMVVLKRLNDALAAGDPIHAVVRGSAVSNDGRGSGALMTPSREGQRKTLHEAWSAAGVHGGQIRFFEAHGTGTSVGDPVEVGAIADALRDDGAINPSWIGSIKSNIGHTESAAGIASLIKTVMALKHRLLPKTLLEGVPNPVIDWAGRGLRLAAQHQDLGAETTPIIAGVSSFGIMGTNSHLIVEEYRPQPIAPSTTSPAKAYLLPVSARSVSALDALLKEYESFSSDEELRDLCYTASMRRRHDEYRSAFVCENLEELRESVAAARRDGLFSGDHAIAASEIKRRIVFIAPGQGSQWAGMARELFAEQPVFRQRLKDCDTVIQSEAGWSVIDVLLGEATEQALQEIDIVQPALFAISVSLAALWRSWGIVPDAVVGHSMGEVAAACIAGALSLEDAAAVICRRSRLMKSIRGSGAMLTVELPVRAIRLLLNEAGGAVSVGASNSQGTTVVSGDTNAIERIETILIRREIFCRRIRVDVASHSSQVDPILTELRSSLSAVKPKQCEVDLFSTVTGEYLAGPEMDAGYWVNNLRESVNYAAAIQTLVSDGCEVFVELSPHAILAPATEETLRTTGRNCIVVASGRRGQPEMREILGALGSLHCYGCEVAWQSFYPDTALCVALPEYQFQRERCWPDLEELKVGRSLRRHGRRAAHPLLSQRFESSMQPETVVWEIDLDLSAKPYLRDHKVHGTVVLPAAAQIEVVLEALYVEQPGTQFDLTAVRFESAMQIAEGSSREFQLGLRRDGNNGFSFEIHSRAAHPSEGWMLHTSGNAEAQQRHEGIPSNDTARQVTNGWRHVDAARHYRLRKRAGVDYGPAFRLLEELWYQPGESLGRIALAPQSNQAAGRYRLNPSVLDSCFQALQYAEPDGHGFMQDDTFLPASIGCLIVYNDLPAQGDIYCRIWLVHADATAGALCCNLSLEDGHGTIVVGVEEIRLQRISASMDERAGELLLEPAWLPFKPSDELKPAADGRLVVIFCDSSGTGEMLADGLASSGGRALLVRHNQESANESAYTIDPTQRDGVMRLITDLAAQGDVPSDIVHLWSLDQPVFNESEVGSVLSAQTLGTYFIPWLVQAIAECDWTNPPRLWLVTNGAMSTGGDTSTHLAAAPLWGVGSVVSVEHPELRASMVDLSNRPTEDEIGSLLRVLLASPDEDRFALRQRRILLSRFVRPMRELPHEKARWLREDMTGAPNLPDAKTKLFRKDATYLITGGMGGVGSTVAEWMAANGAGYLVLISRREPNAETQEIVSRIEAHGTRVHHARTDIVDRHAVDAMLAEVRTAMPPIKGIMHAATVIDDALIADLSPERFPFVMGPKVKGTWNLYAATSEDGLDFMVLFSSIAAMYSQPGHGSYAAANAFMDSFAYYARSKGRSVSTIDWGGWDGIGLTREAGTGRSVSGYGLQGFRAMAGPLALSALKRVMETGPVQSIATPFDVDEAAEFHGPQRIPTVLRSLLAEANEHGNEAAKLSAVQEKLSHALSYTDSLNVLSGYLIEELSRVLKLAPERIGKNTLFGSIGLDSLMTLEFVRRIKAGLGVAVPTTSVYNHPTAELLAADIARRMEMHPEAAIDPPDSEANTARFHEMASALVSDEVSDDEALLTLLQPVGR